MQREHCIDSLFLRPLFVHNTMTLLIINSICSALLICTFINLFIDCICEQFHRGIQCNLNSFQWNCSNRANENSIRINNDGDDGVKSNKDIFPDDNNTIVDCVMLCVPQLNASFTAGFYHHLPSFLYPTPRNP